MDFLKRISSGLSLGSDTIDKSNAYQLESVQVRVDRMAVGLKTIWKKREVGCLARGEFFFKDKMICFQIN